MNHPLENIFAWRDGTGTPEGNALAEAHVSACMECRRMFTRPTVAPSEAFVTRVIAGLDRQELGFWARLRSLAGLPLLRWSLAGAAALAIALAVIPRRSPPPVVVASAEWRDLDDVDPVDLGTKIEEYFL